MRQKGLTFDGLPVDLMKGIYMTKSLLPEAVPYHGILRPPEQSCQDDNRILMIRFQFLCCRNKSRYRRTASSSIPINKADRLHPIFHEACIQLPAKITRPIEQYLGFLPCRKSANTADSRLLCKETAHGLTVSKMLHCVFLSKMTYFVINVSNRSSEYRALIRTSV